MKSYFFKVLLWIATTALIMLGLPWLAVTFSDNMSGMIVSIILFYAIDPLYVLVMGACAGQNLKGYWYLPLGCAGLFLLGIWLYISKDLSQFYSYAVVYLALGLVSMFISFFFKRGSAPSTDIKVQHFRFQACIYGIKRDGGSGNEYS